MPGIIQVVLQLAISEEQIRDILGEIITPPLALFSFKIKKLSISMILEVVLDHLENRYGSASLDDCERVSRGFGARMESLEPEMNYQLKVQSAGAERKLRLPDDLYRFQGLVMNLEILSDEGNFIHGIFLLKEIQSGFVVLESTQGRNKKGKNPKLMKFGVDRVKKGNLVIQF